MGHFQKFISRISYFKIVNKLLSVVSFIFGGQNTLRYSPLVEKFYAFLQRPAKVIIDTVSPLR